MTPDELALTRAVCENPADDLPRLVLCDFWDDNGQPERAEFARLQVEIDRLPARCDKTCDPLHAAPQSLRYWRPHCRCRACKMRRKAWAVFRRHNGDWERACTRPVWESVETELRRRVASQEDPWGVQFPPGLSVGVWRRGFPTVLHAPLNLFLEWAARLFELCPYTEVLPEDVEPNPMGGTNYSTNWFLTDQRPTAVTRFQPTHWLPRVFAPYLTGEYHPHGLGRTGHPEGAVIYENTLAARADLALAMVRYGREKAGLSPLPVPQSV